MKFSVAAVAAFAGLTLGQDIQSKPFKLVLSVRAGSLNGQVLTACHTGAGIESLCLTSGKGSTFTFNTTQGTSNLEGYTPVGMVTYDLQYSNGVASQPLTLEIEPSTNVAMPLFGSSQAPASYFMFDTQTNTMRVASYLDDTANPPKSTDGTALARWFLCNTIYGGYQYRTLNWVLGQGQPQNPTCQPVDVARQF